MLKYSTLHEYTLWVMLTESLTLQKSYDPKEELHNREMEKPFLFFALVILKVAH